MSEMLKLKVSVIDANGDALFSEIMGETPSEAIAQNMLAVVAQSPGLLARLLEALVETHGYGAHDAGDLDPDRLDEVCEGLGELYQDIVSIVPKSPSFVTEVFGEVL